MIRFSLTRLQQQAPYELILSGDSFMFQTDLGIHYSISFMKEDISFAGCDTYQFIIRKIEEKPPGYRPRGIHSYELCQFL